MSRWGTGARLRPSVEEFRLDETIEAAELELDRLRERSAIVFVDNATAFAVATAPEAVEPPVEGESASGGASFVSPGVGEPEAEAEVASVTSDDTAVYGILPELDDEEPPTRLTRANRLLS